MFFEWLYSADTLRDDIVCVVESEAQVHCKYNSKNT